LNSLARPHRYFQGMSVRSFTWRVMP
jgi:hypothetical protein